MLVKDGEKGVLPLEPIPTGAVPMPLKRKEDGSCFTEPGRSHKDGKPASLQREPLDAIAEKAAQGNGRELQLCLKERWFHVGAPSDSDGFRRSIAKNGSSGVSVGGREAAHSV